MGCEGRIVAETRPTACALPDESRSVVVVDLNKVLRAPQVTQSVFQMLPEKVQSALYVKYAVDDGCGGEPKVHLSFVKSDCNMPLRIDVFETIVFVNDNSEAALE